MILDDFRDEKKAFFLKLIHYILIVPFWLTIGLIGWLLIFIWCLLRFIGFCLLLKRKEGWIDFKFDMGIN